MIKESHICLMCTDWNPVAENMACPYMKDFTFGIILLCTIVRLSIYFLRKSLIFYVYYHHCLRCCVLQCSGSQPEGCKIIRGIFSM